MGRSWVRFPARVAGEFSYPGPTLCADFYFDICPSLCYHSSSKRSRSFNQKCRWQVTTKQACTLCMYLRIELLNAAWLYGAHRMCTKMAAVLQGTSYVAIKQHCKYTTLLNIQNVLCKKLHSFIQSCMRLECSESAQKQRIVLYIKQARISWYKNDQSSRNLKKKKEKRQNKW